MNNKLIREAIKQRSLERTSIYNDTETLNNSQ